MTRTSFNYLSLPYTPQRQRKKKPGRPTPYAYLHRIAYTETFRGLADDVPTLLFYGAPFLLLRDACGHLFKVLAGKVKNLLIQWEHSCRRRNGKCYWRVAVSVIRLDEHFLSLKEFTLLLVSHMQRICNCTVRHYRLETFLNL